MSCPDCLQGWIHEVVMVDVQRPRVEVVRPCATCRPVEWDRWSRGYSSPPTGSKPPEPTNTKPKGRKR